MLHHLSPNFSPALISILLLPLWLSRSTASTCYWQANLHPDPLVTEDCLFILAHLPNAIGDDSRANAAHSYNLITDPANLIYPIHGTSSLPFLPRVAFLHDRCKIDISIRVLDNPDGIHPNEQTVLLAWTAIRARARFLIKACLEGGFTGGDERIRMAKLGTQRVNWYVNVHGVPVRRMWPDWSGHLVHLAKRALRGVTPPYVSRLFRTTYYVI